VSGFPGFWLGFEMAGWFAVFVFMISSSLSPAATQGYLNAVGVLVGPALARLVDDKSSPSLMDGIEFAIVAFLLVVPELLFAGAGGWLLDRTAAGTIAVRAAREPLPPL
jgi:hypothetical protein